MSAVQHNAKILASDQRTFHDTDSAYALPNDNIEHKRLELQHGLLRQLMGGKLFHAPLQNEKMHKTLDIGCGTGAVTNEMATAFPAAQVYGVDLSPVPPVRQKLENISYIQGNIMEMEDSRFSKDSFDFIFSRLLVVGMSNWKAYIERCVSLAKPGGWIEMHDHDLTVRRVPAAVSSLDHLRPHSMTLAEIRDSTHPTDAYHELASLEWEETMAKSLALKGADHACGAKIPSLFAEAGLVDIRVTRYMLPYGRWEGLTPAEKEMADYMETFARDVFPVLLRRAGDNAGPEYAQEVDEALQGAKRFAEAYDGSRTFMFMYVVCGRKPE